MIDWYKNAIIYGVDISTFMDSDGKVVDLQNLVLSGNEGVTIRV